MGLSIKTHEEMRRILYVIVATIVCATIYSCSTYQKIRIIGEPGTEIYTPDKEKIATIESNGKTVINLSRDTYYAFLMAGSKDSDLRIPFALDYSNRSFIGARMLYVAELGLGFACSGALVIGTIPILCDSEDESGFGKDMYTLGGIGALAGGLSGMVTSSRLQETQRQWQFEYLSRQSTNQDLRFEKFVDNGYRKEIGDKAVSVDENMAESDRKVESVQSESSSSAAKSRSSKSKRTLTDLAKQVEGTYIGSGKLLLKDETIESYQNIKVVLKRLDKNTVQVDVYESNGEAYFNESGKYSVKKIDSGKYQLTMNGIPSATITIDANKKMVYLHPKVNIDGDLYALRITASKSTQANQDVNLIIETLNGVVGKEFIKSEKCFSNTVKGAYAQIEYDNEYDEIEFEISDKSGSFTGYVFELIEKADPSGDPEFGLFCWEDVVFTFANGRKVTEKCRLLSFDKNNFTIEGLGFTRKTGNTSETIKSALLTSDIKRITIKEQSIDFADFNSCATIKKMRTYKL